MSDSQNTQAFIEAQQYSAFIVENLPDLALPEGFARDVSDFASGTTLNIKTVGSRTIQDVAEGVPMTFSPIDTNTITMSITDYVGDAWSVSDELRRDGAQVETLMAMQAMEATRGISENIETKFLAACDNAQTGAALNNVNGRAHRWIAGGKSGTSRNMTMADFVAAKLAFDKANVPQGGRIAIVDPIVEATLNSLTNLVNVSNNPMFEGIVTEGFARDHKFVRNIFGFDIWTSNKLPLQTAVEAINADAQDLANDSTVVGDVVNVFMSVMDDNSKPMMKATRVTPSVEGWRDSEDREDKFQTTANFGFGAQRVDSLICVITDSLTY
jgi:hypothetical protein